MTPAPEDLLFIAGVGSIIAGVAMLSVPLALIVTGGALIYGALLITKPVTQPRKETK